MNTHFAQALVVVLLILAPTQSWAGGKKKPETPPSESSTQSSSADRVWIARLDGAKSCGQKEPQTEEEAATELKKAGVQVLNSGKGKDNKIRAAMCGMPTGGVLRFLVPAGDVPKAMALGFTQEKSTPESRSN